MAWKPDRFHAVMLEPFYSIQKLIPTFSKHVSFFERSCSTGACARGYQVLLNYTSGRTVPNKDNTVVRARFLIDRVLF
jgi:hypothetical protein